MDVGIEGKIAPEEFWAPVGKAAAAVILQYGWQIILLIFIGVCLILTAKYGFAHRTAIKKLEHEGRASANMEKALEAMNKLIDAKIGRQSKPRVRRRKDERREQ